MTHYEGGCHCGALRYDYATGIPPEGWSVRSCQCSFCTRHASACTSDPNGVLRFVHPEPERLLRYRFALGTADFLLCGRCGVYVGAVLATPDGAFGLVNLRTLDAAPAALPAAEPTRHDAEDVAARVERRRRSWTPVEPAG